MNMEPTSQPQPLLPQISMRWYFLVAGITAAMIVGIARQESSEKLGIIVGLLGLACMVFLTLSAFFFAIAYIVGAVESLLLHAEEQPESPFATETMPPQIMPPVSNE